MIYNKFAIFTKLPFISLMLFSRFSLSEMLCELPTSLKGNITLNKSCIYSGGLTIADSYTSLDCNGAEIDASKFKDGILISSKGKEIKNITIKNCKIKNAIESGIRSSWLGRDTNKSKELNRYLKTPHKIIIDNVEIIKSGKNGIFIDDYSSFVTIKKSTIKYSGSTAIYIEHDSKNNIIDSNLIQFNGYKNDFPRREAIAIDSSQHNIIINNNFINNGLGGIFIYKNCSEQIHSGKQEIRKMHSNYNVIEGNHFENEKIGVWLASRQNKNLKKWIVAMNLLILKDFIFEIMLIIIR
ncbi:MULTISPECIES: right-handed parallel beta-helix repeat-containing protein [unclassified Leclercia]|uniref:right-handed parallel beta-helix repeat-containing protein n=1 Tax=unclassified Leclercia TaxID=2627398 RepID=UPI0020746615|nr:MULTISPECIES: right-handed parallel beta-helix repeat-containing protein [unclassified Leclercia]MCM5696507.1 right-handed parallel beta-helix repeat-containing protein [Leclercia sp. LTM01]MCM5700293.1 right-handed parallel beta-helix repeat-containing protein [Leclercia sp. LTM14]